MKKKFHSRRRSNYRILIYTKITASLPFIEVDLNLTSQQMSMLINGLKYILPCQTQYSRKPIDEILKEQYQNISKPIKNCLSDHGMFTTDTRAQQAFSELEHIINAFKSQKISKKLRKRAQYEYKTIQSIRRLLRQRPDIILCRTDKTKTLYIGNVTTMTRKAYEYMTKTVAYQEINNGRSPLADILYAVNTLLDYIVRTKGLTDKQSKKLYPNLNQLELAHYHGLPKTHKVKIKNNMTRSSSFSIFILFTIGRNTTTAYYCIYSRTNNIAFKIFK
jgi:hypothetical protein